MSRYIKKNRRYFLGVAVPVLLLFVLGTVGLSVYPGWVKTTYGAIGAACTNVSTDPADPLLNACDPCLGEQCQFSNSSSQCVQAFNGTFCPNIFGTQFFPTCWNSCTPTIIGTGTFTQTFDCSPNDSVCNGFVGGTQPNLCRTAICNSTNSTFDTINPSGCEYTLLTGGNCILCATPAPSTFTSCGNGICEPGLGETCASCEVDCRLPGFTGACPLPVNTPDSAFANNCRGAPAAIVFDSGPPFNQIPGQCEDGDICTDNTCSPTTSSQCDSTPTQCSGNNGDFCCPAVCTPPPSGGTCTVGAANTCDVDCYTPQICQQPTPTPTPIPSPTPPVFGLCVNGGGLHGNNGSLTCDGFSCTLNPFSGDHGAAYAWMLLVAAFGLAGAWALRRNQS